MQKNIVAIYARFSSDNQNPKSITDQYRKCEEWIMSMLGSDVEIIHYKDEAISGTSSNRPGYQSMIRDGVAGKFSTLVIDDLSRLSRDTLESNRVLKEFKFYGVRIIAVADGIDSSAEGYKLHAGIKALINEEYIDALAKKTHRGLEGRAIEGKHCGGRTYGYDVVSLGEDQGSVLEVNPEQAKWVRQIFEWYADGHTPRWIAAKLNEMGVKTSRTGKKIKNKWSSNAIYGDQKRQTGMLNCQTYIGRLIWNKRKWLKTPDGRRVPRLNPESEWKVSECTDLQIVDDVLWKRVKNRQKAIREKSCNIRKALHQKARSGRGPKYLLSGLLTCSGCGANYVMVNKNDYGCSTYRDRGEAACKNKLRVRRELIESRVFGSFKDYLFTPKHLTTFKKLVEKALKEAIQQKQALDSGDKDRLKRIDKEIANLMVALKKGIVSPTIQAELKSLEEEKVKYEQRVRVEVQEIDQIHSVMPEIEQSFKDILNCRKPVPVSHVAKLRGRIQMILGESIKMKPKTNSKGLIAEIQSRYKGLLKLSGLSDDKLNLVAGERLGIKLQNLSEDELNLVAGRGFEPLTFRL